MNDPGIPMTRRAVLRGAGALLALPFLESLRPAAAIGGAASAGPPQRLGIFTVTGGTVVESWRPQETGPLTKLPSILRPLEFARGDVLILSNLAHGGKSEGLNAHEHCAYLHLTAADEVKKVGGKVHAALSVDQAAAAAVGTRTFLPSLELGLNANQTYSFRGPDAPLPPEGNPRLVFDRMFRGRKPVAPNWRRRAASSAKEVRRGAKPDSLEQGVLDLVLEDARDLHGKLGTADKRKLDEYLHAVRSVETRLAFLEVRQQEEARDAADPGPSKLVLPTGLPREGAPIWEVTRPIEGDPERHADYIRLLADLMVLAFQTDTTRVVTLAAGSDDCAFPGVVTVGYERHCHTLEHQGNAGRVEDADPIAREALRQIHVWYTQLFAEVVRKMKAIDEGGSSLLDNTMLLYTSYMADGGHGREDYPVLLAGKGGGTLKPGRHLRFADKTPVANLYVELLDRMGVKAGRFGDSHTAEHRRYDGRLPGLG